MCATCCTGPYISLHRHVPGQLPGAYLARTAAALQRIQMSETFRTPLNKQWGLCQHAQYDVVFSTAELSFYTQATACLNFPLKQTSSYRTSYLISYMHAHTDTSDACMCTMCARTGGCINLGPKPAQTASGIHVPYGSHRCAKGPLVCADVLAQGICQTHKKSLAVPEDTHLSLWPGLRRNAMHTGRLHGAGDAH